MNPANCAKVFLFSLIPFLGAESLGQAPVIDSLKRAVSLSEKNDVETAERFQALATQYWRLKPDSSIYFADKALSIGQVLRDEKIIAVSEYLKATVLLDRNENVAARSAFLKIAPFFEKIGDKEHFVRSIINTGTSFLNENNYPEASAYFEKGLEAGKMFGNRTWQAMAIGNLGIVTDMEGKKKRAIELYVESLKVHESVGDNARAAVLYHDIGSLYSNLEDQQNAIAYTRKACERYKMAKNFKSLNSANLNLVYYFYQIDSTEVAERYVDTLERAIFPLNSAQKLQLLLVKGQIAEKKLDFPTAISLLKECADEAQKVNSPISEHNARATLSRIYFSQKNYGAALAEIEASLKIGTAMGDAMTINGDQKLAAKYAAALGQHRSAYEYLDAFEKGRDTIYTQERFAAIKEVEERYESEKKERIIAEQHLDIAKKRNWLWLAGLFSGAMALVGFVQFSKKQQEKLLNQLLKNENAQFKRANENLVDEMGALKNKLHTEGFFIQFTGQDKKLLRHVDILYVKSDGNTVDVFTVDGKRHTEWVTMKTIGEELAKSGLFFQIHRSWIVNYRHIKNRRATELVMSNNEIARIGNTLKKEVDEWLDEKLG